MPTSRQLAILADPNGRVVAAHLIDEQTRQGHTGIRGGMLPLQGQTLHEVDVPTELADAEPKEVLRRIHGGYHIKAGALARKEN
jgi:hypothetical protein